MYYVLGDQEMSLIKKMELEARKYTGVVSLAQGVPWYRIPDSVMEYLIEKVQKGQTNRYSIVPGIPELREQVALRYFKKYGVEIDFENEIIITCGAIQAISSILLTICDKDDEVILMDPCYASYRGCVQITKANPIYVPLDLSLDLDIDAIKNSISSVTKAIVICNPNNPTGTIFSLEKIEQILEIIRGTEIVLILDEVYDEFLYDGNSFDSAIKLYDKYKNNLIVVNSWSKTFGMTGWRVGYIVCNDSLMHEIVKVHDSLVTCAPVHSQRAALSTFEIYDERTQDVREKLQQRRDYTIKKLKSMSEYIDFKVPGAAYFVFPKFRYTDDDYQECLKILHEKKVALVPGSGFGYRGKGHFRICFGRDFDDLTEGLQRLEDYFRGR